MKRILHILTLLFLFTTGCYAQNEEQTGKISERLKEFLQKKLNLSSSEADRFGPVYLNYFNELRKTRQEYKGDNLLQQQKAAEVRLHYRDQFKDIMGEKRSNDIFNYERDFINEAKKVRDERMQNQLEGRGNKRPGD